MYFWVLCLFEKCIILQVSVIFVETFVKSMMFLRPLWPFDHVLNIMLCFLCLFVLMYDIGIMFDMIYNMIFFSKVRVEFLPSSFLLGFFFQK